MSESQHENLITAINQGQLDRVSSLLNEGCDQQSLDSGLCWSSRNGRTDLITLLLQYGANPNAEVWGGFSPLLWAAMFSPNSDAVRVLLAAGSHIDHYSAKRRQTALHAAVIRGNVECARILLESGADPDIQDYLYKTPVLHSVHRGHIPCVKLLIKHNCNVNLTGWVGGTSISPLVLALVRNDLDTTKLLILAGARFDRPAVYQTYNIRQYYDTVENGLHLEVRPVYLQQQCRVCIRHVLKPMFLEKLEQMQLPVRLTEYLQIREMDF